MKTKVQILTEAKALIEDPANWIKENASDGGCKFCMVGAVSEVYGLTEGDAERGAGTLLSKVVWKLSRMSIPAFNDLRTTTHADVMKAFDLAIAKAKETE